MGKIIRDGALFETLAVDKEIFIESYIKGYSSWEIYSRFDTGIAAFELVEAVTLNVILFFYKGVKT